MIMVMIMTLARVDKVISLFEFEKVADGNIWKRRQL